MSKKMITFLGTGNYGTGIYSFDDFNKEKTSFVQTGLARYLEPEEVVVLITKQAEDKNWDKLEEARKKAGTATPPYKRPIPTSHTNDDTGHISQT